jgi:hypothetical protein
MNSDLSPIMTRTNSQIIRAAVNVFPAPGIYSEGNHVHRLGQDPLDQRQELGVQ